MKASIGKIAKELGVSRDTPRRWEAKGKIIAERTARGHRRYDLAKFSVFFLEDSPSQKIRLRMHEFPVMTKKRILRARQTFYTLFAQQDVLEIITVFSVRLYGAISRKNQKVLEALKEAAATL